MLYARVGRKRVLKYQIFLESSCLQLFLFLCTTYARREPPCFVYCFTPTPTPIRFSLCFFCLPVCLPARLPICLSVYRTIAFFITGHNGIWFLR